MVIIMNKSFWQQNSKTPHFPNLNQDLNVDILIIGGGLSGAMVSYYLKESTYKIAVIEKNQFGSHSSGHSTAKITCLHGLILQQIAQSYNYEQAYLYYLSNKEAMQDIEHIISKEQIDCDFQKNTAYIYTDDKQKLKILKKEKSLLKSFGEKIIEKNDHLMTFGLENQAIFDPIRYLYRIIEICQSYHIDFYENAQATAVHRYRDHYLVKVNDHCITCKYVVHATRYPFIKKGAYFLKLFQTRSYVEHKSTIQGPNSYLSIDYSCSYRPVNNSQSLIINNHSSQWFAQDSIALRGIPYIGQYKKNEYIIYGFQKWGMTLSHVAGKLIRDLILHDHNPYQQLYYCHYFSISNSRKYLPAMIRNSLQGYILQRYMTRELKDLSTNDGTIIKIKHHLYAVYKDSHQKLHVFSPYCPHLKCIIHFNRKSHTWDCPCHQSVFNAYGQLIEGPSLYSLKKIVNDKYH